MEYRDYRVGFTFEVPDEYSEVKEASYEVFEVAPNTLHYFIELDDDGEILRSFSLSHDRKVKNEKDCEKLAEDSVKFLVDNGYKIEVQEVLETNKDRLIYRYVLSEPDSADGIGLLLYFTRVKDEAIISSAFVESSFDDNEMQLLQIFDSFNEF